MIVGRCVARCLSSRSFQLRLQALDMVQTDQISLISGNIAIGENSLHDLDLVSDNACWPVLTSLLFRKYERLRALSNR